MARAAKRAPALHLDRESDVQMIAAWLRTNLPDATDNERLEEYAIRQHGDQPEIHHAIILFDKVRRMLEWGDQIPCPCGVPAAEHN